MPNNGRVRSKNPLYNLGALTRAGGRKFTLKPLPTPYTMSANPLFGLGASAEASAGGASEAVGVGENVSFTSPLPGLVPASAPAPASAAPAEEGGSTLNPLSGLGLGTAGRSGILGIRNLRNSRRKPVISINPLQGKNAASSKPPLSTSVINPLAAAAEVNPIRGVRNLLRSKAAQNEPLSLGEVEVNIDISQEQLFDAIKKNDLAKVTALIGQGVDINTAGRNGYHPLMYALYKNPTDDIAILLINNGANLDNVFGKGSITPLMIAAGRNKYRIVQELIKNSVDINAKTVGGDPPMNGQTALFYAISSVSIESVILLLQNGADLNDANEGGETPLHFAVFSVLQMPATPISKDIHKELLAMGLRIPEDYPAHLSIVRLLIQYGADINAKTNTGQTVFMIDGVDKSPSLLEALRYNPTEQELIEACLHGRMDILLSLFNTGRVTRETINSYEFDREFENGNNPKEKGFTPLILALRSKNVAVAKYLVENGADPNKSGKHKRTPLGVACFYCTENEGDIINFLIDKGADILKTDTVGYSALDMAIQGLSLKNSEIILTRYERNRGAGHLSVSFSTHKFILSTKELEGERGEKARAIHSLILIPYGKILEEKVKAHDWTKSRRANRKSRRANRKSRKSRRATRKSQGATRKNKARKNTRRR